MTTGSSSNEEYLIADRQIARSVFPAILAAYTSRHSSASLSPSPYRPAADSKHCAKAPAAVAGSVHCASSNAARYSEEICPEEASGEGAHDNVAPKMSVQIAFSTVALATLRWIRVPVGGYGSGGSRSALENGGRAYATGTRARIRVGDDTWEIEAARVPMEGPLQPRPQIAPDRRHRPLDIRVRVVEVGREAHAGAVAAAARRSHDAVILQRAHHIAR